MDSSNIPDSTTLRGRRIGLALFSLFFSLILVEGILHLLPRQPDVPPAPQHQLPWIQFHPVFGWANRYGYVGPYVKEGVFSTRITIDPRGYREIAKPRRSQHRVLVLGDSFTFGHGVNDHETWPARLAEYNPNMEVLNSAVVGWGHDQQVLCMRDLIKFDNPDLVIWGWSSADFPRNTMVYWRLRDATTGLDFAKPRYVLRDGKLELTNAKPVSPEHLDAAIAAYVAERKARGGALRRGLRKFRLFELSENAVDTINLKVEQLRLGEALLLEGIHVARKSGKRIVLVHLPVQKWVHSKNPVTRLKRFLTEKMLKRVVETTGVEFVDCMPAFQALSGEKLDALFLPDDGHYTPAGHQLVADVVNTALEE